MEIVSSGDVVDDWSAVASSGTVASGAVGTRTALLANVGSGGSLTFETSEPIPAEGTVSLVFSGTALTRAALEVSLEDGVAAAEEALPSLSPASLLSSPSPSGAATLSENAVLLSEVATSGAGLLFGPDGDGFWRVEVNLTALAGGDASASVSGVLLSDVSGSGFGVGVVSLRVLEDGFGAEEGDESDVDEGDGVEAEAVAGAPASESTVTETASAANETAEAPSNAIPVYGPYSQFSVLDTSGYTSSYSFIVAFRSNMTIGTLQDVVVGRANNTDESIALTINTANVSTTISVSWTGIATWTVPRYAVGSNGNTDLTAPLSWRFATVVPIDENALDLLRNTLGDYIEYFERDSVIGVSDEAWMRSSGPALPSRRSLRVAYNEDPVPWGIDRVDQTSLPLNGVFSPSGYGGGVHVYVLDSGLYASHIDFVGRVGEGYAVDGSGDTADNNGHGTHVAGTAVGAVHGIARQATVHPVRVVNAFGKGTASQLVAGYGWVQQHVATNGWAAVASTSITGTSSTSVNDAISSLVAANVPVIAASGNGYGADACSTSPGGASAAITVSGTTPTDDLGSFSNVGSCVDILAPGQDIVSAGITSTTSEATMTGTSQATPHVTGAVAVLLGLDPTLTAAEVSAKIVGSAADIPTAGTAIPAIIVQVEDL